MTYRVDLAVEVDEALAELYRDGRQEVMELIAAALADPNSWPARGGWDWGLRSGARLWIMFTAYQDGIDVIALGEIDDLLQAA